MKSECLGVEDRLRYFLRDSMYKQSFRTVTVHSQPYKYIKVIQRPFIKISDAQGTSILDSE